MGVLSPLFSSENQNAALCEPLHRKFFVPAEIVTLLLRNPEEVEIVCTYRIQYSPS